MTNQVPGKNDHGDFHAFFIFFYLYIYFLCHSNMQIAKREIFCKGYTGILVKVTQFDLFCFYSVSHSLIIAVLLYLWMLKSIYYT